MKRFDYYMILGTLLLVWLLLLNFEYETQAGMFLGVFIYKIKDLLNVNTKEKVNTNIRDLDIPTQDLKWDR